MLRLQEGWQLSLMVRKETRYRVISLGKSNTYIELHLHY